MRAQPRRNRLPNLAELRVERDRTLARSYLRKKRQGRKAVEELMKETGVPRRTIYRAIQRELDYVTHEEGSGAGDTRNETKK